jgi:hypothetical protein
LTTFGQGIRALVLAAGLAAPALALDVVAPLTPEVDVIPLRTANVRPAQLVNLLESTSPLPDDGGFLVVPARRPTLADRSQLAALGVHLHDYLHPGAYVADMAGCDLAGVRSTGLLAGVYRVEGAWKIDPALAQGANAVAWQTEERTALAAMDRVAVALWLFTGRAPDRTLAALRADPRVAVTTTGLVAGGHVVYATMPSDAVAGLASLPDLFIAEHQPEITSRSLVRARWISESNVQGFFPLSSRGLTGAGQIVGVTDVGMTLQHCSFLDPVNPVGPTHRKVHAFNVWQNYPYSLHGLHVSGSFCGDNGVDDDRRGVAYGARLVYAHVPIISEPDVYAKFDLHRSQGAVVHNSSWGDENTNTYNGTCRALDSFVRDHEDQVLVNAVSDGALCTNPENAKNLIAVAAVSAFAANSWCFGGAGPTVDGRRVPHIMGPGCSLTGPSGATGCGTFSRSGTSHACPVVAGMATLTRQYFLDGYYPSGLPNAADAFAPSGALIKAALMNGAQNITGEAGYPGNREGWGRVNGDAALYFDGDARKLIINDVRNSDGDALDQGDLEHIDLRVTSSDMPLRVTMVFTDQPGAANTGYPVVNNLDLEVEYYPTTETYLGNVFAGEVSVQGGAPDPINNIEQVLIPAPAVGRWRITVNAAAVTSDAKQGYALVISGGVAPGACNDLDFNNDGLYPDVQDIEDFIVVFGGGECSTGNCDPTDFNNDGLFPDQEDLTRFLAVFGGGECDD